jgi:hypothetical protein
MDALDQQMDVAEQFVKPVCFWLQGLICQDKLYVAAQTKSGLQPGYAAKYARHISFARFFKLPQELVSVWQGTSQGICQGVCKGLFKEDFNVVHEPALCVTRCACVTD